MFLWKISRWPFQTSIAQELDAVQCQMLAYMLPCVPHVNESTDHFCRRRLRQARNVASHAGLWSLMWAKRVIDWQDHVSRGSAYDHFCSQLSDFHDNDWIQAQRIPFVNSRNSVFAGRTGTRLNIGRPQTRWSHGVANAHAAINARTSHARGSNALSLSTRLREAIGFVRNASLLQS